MNKLHEISGLLFSDSEMVITVDGVTYHLNIEDVSIKLLNAGQVERERYEISASGDGIHWPLLDEDLSVNGLLGIVQMPSFAYKKAA